MNRATNPHLNVHFWDPNQHCKILSVNHSESEPLEPNGPLLCTHTKSDLIVCHQVVSQQSLKNSRIKIDRGMISSFLSKWSCDEIVWEATYILSASKNIALDIKSIHFTRNHGLVARRFIATSHSVYYRQ